MKYFSTRGSGPVSLDLALQQGIALDGGLYVPEELPRIKADEFRGESIQDTAQTLLAPFFSGSSLRENLREIIAETFSFPIPVTTLSSDPYAGLLELYHGPTAAFKDVGAGFLAACLSRLRRDSDDALTILVATSGDTGGAVAAAFNKRPGIRVVVLYPEGRVSARQEKQLSCWDDNVLSLRVRGSFDDCQALAKAAMANQELSEKHNFSSANSINIGRLLPQTTYYAHSSRAHFARTGEMPSYIIPTGNLGNALACIMAREMGLPIDAIVLATNANSLIVDFLDGARWEPRESLQTLASAMDVGNPSNMERLRHWLGEAGALKQSISAVAVRDADIEYEIRGKFKDYGFAICPHTATASWVYGQLHESIKLDRAWILVATAHPAKFEQIVEPLIGANVPLPDSLTRILARPNRAVTIDANMASLDAVLEDNFAA